MTRRDLLDDLRRHLDDVPSPQPMVDRDDGRDLTARQSDLLDRLGDLVDDGFAHLTMTEIASSLQCSLRTLYSIAPTRDRLVLTAVDRKLGRIGRAARGAIRPDMAPLEAIRAYLRAATVAVSRTTPAFARDLAAVAEAANLQREHNEHLYRVTHALLEVAAERGDVRGIPTPAVARVMAGLGGLLFGPEVSPSLGSSPKQAADAVLDIVLDGVRSKQDG
ncbi:TetR/AcrR family transcriptional regulator [Mycobacterium manitobense]|uniref:TetR/AcrR family transcriptional regulator n=1 Tax=[Mycobacterium] manitobense TaxID=190147 RepID=A0A9X2YLQ2_9MYCO|nr:TetR/AcrR family transcriptional regulator [[Mycobacterium] manitobense]MCV7169571.1 TetR/AcrR family transcriptional regulator [[Mycobacterium] manitobense]